MLNNTLHHSVSHCNTLQHTATHEALEWHEQPQALQVDILNDTLHHSASHCNTVHHTAPHLQHTAPHYNTLQHAATHEALQQHGYRQALQVDIFIS